MSEEGRVEGGTTTEDLPDDDFGAGPLPFDETVGFLSPAIRRQCAASVGELSSDFVGDVDADGTTSGAGAGAVRGRLTPLVGRSASAAFG